MLPFLKKQEGSVSQEVEAVKREPDNDPKIAIEAVKKALHQAKQSIDEALKLLGGE